MPKKANQYATPKRGRKLVEQHDEGVMPDIPEWVSDTPPETSYELVLWDADMVGEQQIKLTRAEYIALKAHLAAMRGYTVRNFRAQIAELSTAGTDGCQFYRDTNADQNIRWLDAAREFYRVCPDLVVCPDRDLDDYVSKAARKL